MTPPPPLPLFPACHPARSAGLSALWPLLQLVLPDVAEAVRTAVQRLQDLLDPGPSNLPARTHVMQVGPGELLALPCQ